MWTDTVHFEAGAKRKGLKMDKTKVKKIVGWTGVLVARPLIVLAMGAGVLFCAQSFLNARETGQSHWFSNCGWSRAHASMDAGLGHAAWCAVGKMFEGSEVGGSPETGLGDFFSVPRH